MLTAATAHHLLRRVGFSARNRELRHFQGMEEADAVDEILAASPSLPANRQRFLNHFDWWDAMNEMRWWWVQRMIDARWTDRAPDTPSPLVEKMTLFWHSHFATGVEKVEDHRAVFRQNQRMRRHSLGRFQTLLHGVCTDGALLRYLDNDTNEVGNPQENFARELMELHTIGPDEFAERDVIAMAKAWTGHGVRGWSNGRWDARYRKFPDLHDNSRKRLFGGPPTRWDGPDTLRLFTSGVKRTATARFITTKLWHFFVNDHPTTAEIDGLAAIFARSMDVRELMRAMLLHDAFWASRNQIVRSPIEFAVDILRRTGVTPKDSGIHRQMAPMGQRLFEPPSVAGWGTNAYWVSTQASWGKAKFVGHLRWHDRVHAMFSDILAEPSATAGANRIVATLGIHDPSPATLDALRSFWSSHSGAHRWAAKNNAIVVGAMTPEFQVG